VLENKGQEKVPGRKDSEETGDWRQLDKGCIFD
jgi:hypothetical protein